MNSTGGDVPGKSMIEVMHDLCDQIVAAADCIKELRDLMNDEKVARMQGDHELELKLNAAVTKCSDALDAVERTMTSMVNALTIDVKVLIVKVTFISTFVTTAITTGIALLVSGILD